ncbi:tyrosine-protein phosphatase [Shewanella salipaludis]|uniref:protein-tyrosine-phosphatase n=1 Tax=Shewanella salipaludis TaxID=2723052 RepID=A0A972FU74_9GAMM|nr:CpsB/CapC family capsule biosynthesis tyrosine phosphatase [Shewanella salipaludis]NMH65374.1 capsule biosynthesis protein CapC [Shewanella salipaludis]
MIDLHCHILPGLDDGAREMDDAIALVRLAAEQGISRMVATPHIQIGRFDNNLATIQAALSSLNEAIAPLDLGVDIRAGAEFRICPEVMMLAERNELPFIGEYQGAKVLLLELPHSQVPAGSDRLVDWLIRNNILPMIAHPERNRELQAFPDRIRPFVRSGCLFQLTAASLVGDFGDVAMALSERWLGEQLFTVIASDAHSEKRRPPKLAQAFARAKELIGETQALELVQQRPCAISQSLFI